MANTAASTLITATLDNLSRASAGTTRSGSTLETEAMRWLNESMRYIAKRYNFRDLLRLYSAVTAEDTKSYALPTNTKDIKDLRIIDGTSSRKLWQVGIRDIDDYMPYPEADVTRKPVWYSRIGETFDLIPIPDDTYTLYMRVYLWPTTITSTSTLIDYAPDKDETIIAFMTQKGFQLYQMYEDALEWKKEAMSCLAAALLDEESDPDFDVVGKGFSSLPRSVMPGDAYNDPMVRSNGVWRGL